MHAWQKVIDTFIARHNLHNSVPVAIERAVDAEGIFLRFTSGLNPVLAYAVALGPVRRITVNANLSSPMRRLAVAHELAHLLLDDLAVAHFWTGDTSPFTQWIAAKTERRANLAAARLLIPPDFLCGEYEDYTAIAAACDVPPWLVEMVAEREPLGSRSREHA